VNRRNYAPASLLPLTVLILTVSALVLVHTKGAVAQGVNVQITELDCEGNPEVVVISNLGDQPVEMTGWNLQSDPTVNESLALASLGFLSPGESILVESGPGSEAAFTWAREFVFRDNDPTDFAQLASDAGDVLLKVNCGSVLQQTPTPAPTQAPTIAPTPTALPAADVPVGGGPPGASAGLISPTVLIVAGSWLLAAGMATFAFPFLRRRGRHEPPEPAALTEALAPTAEASSAVEMAPGRLAAPAVEATASRVTAPAALDPLQRYLFLAVIVLSMVSLLVFLLQFGEKKKE